MAGAIRLVSLQRGYDPRDFILFAFGGAGPLHAAALARELAIPKVLVPARPGITSALGCLVADVRHDFVRTINQDVGPAWTWRRRGPSWPRRWRTAAACSPRKGVEVETVTVLHQADMQFAGQTHVLTVTIPRTDFTREDLVGRLRARLLGALRGGAQADAGARHEPPHRGDRAAPPGVVEWAGDASCPGHGGRGPGGNSPGLVRGRLARHADLPAREARGRQSRSRARPSWSSWIPPPWSRRGDRVPGRRARQPHHLRAGGSMKPIDPGDSGRGPERAPAGGQRDGISRSSARHFRPLSPRASTARTGFTRRTMARSSRRASSGCPSSSASCSSPRGRSSRMSPSAERRASGPGDIFIINDPLRGRHPSHGRQDGEALLLPGTLVGPTSRIPGIGRTRAAPSLADSPPAPPRSSRRACACRR